MWIWFVWCVVYGVGLMITPRKALGDKEKQVLLPGLRRCLVSRCLVSRCLGFREWLLLGELPVPVGDALLLHLVLVGCALLPRAQLVRAIGVNVRRVEELPLLPGPLGGEAGTAAVGRGGLHGDVLG